ncbi:nitrilase and fragile histidine triad fusion protein NitFhit [Drosophila ananassae]|uniref:nitrilase and fragile histidine triad fusion protein NitFhit n=1 Tax=Drosophila ananassae TaxID=7217 RepID=UPI001CFFE298|nr:nitrilase and fragile histidine triad fusion protein NitFhit [Drosophila ananassae]
MSNLVRIARRIIVSRPQQFRKMESSDSVERCSAPTSKGQSTTIAVGQMRSTSDKVANFGQVQELVSRAKSKNATMLFLPECCDFVGENRAQTLELSETLDGQLMAQYRELAKSNGIWLSLGGIHERNSEGKIYNAHVLVDEKGELAAVYRKMHLFDATTKEITLRESNTVSPGERLERPVKTPAGMVGLQICYDLRFAETAVLLRKLGAQLLTYPAAFTYATGKAHWEVLMRARAIETQCFVVAAAQQGWHNKKRQSWGQSIIVDPWGRILADCGNEKELDLGTAEINLSTLDSLYQSMPCFEHRRNDLYSLTAYNIKGKEPTEDRLFAENIVDKRTIFYESEYCFAFTNLRCVVLGHVLVSTKRVTPRLCGLNCAEMSDLFATVCMVQRMLESIYQTTSATVTVQDGAHAGQTVPHVHFHVMPRRQGDFCINDQVYIELDNRDENKPPRTMEDRIDEAQSYRAFLDCS